MEVKSLGGRMIFWILLAYVLFFVIMAGIEFVVKK